MNPFTPPKNNLWHSETASQFRNTIAFVQSYAPDRFPVEDYLPQDEQPNLDGMFWTLFEDLRHARGTSDPQQRMVLETLLKDSHTYYVGGDREAGLKALQAFEDQAFG